MLLLLLELAPVLDRNDVVGSAAPLGTGGEGGQGGKMPTPPRC